MNFIEKYNLWLRSCLVDNDTKNELLKIKGNEKEIEDRFYKDLKFGTGGLRGVLGAGSNRMNIYTIGKATEGISKYLNNKYSNVTVVIAYDSRRMSREFAEYTARVFSANNIKVFLFNTLTPTPILSYAVRKLECDAGVVITASHNPKEYNGYKVYGKDGGQVTDIPAKEIMKFIDRVLSFEEVKVISKEEAIAKGLLKYIGEEIYSPYIENVKNLTIRKKLVKEKAKELKVIYTPLHGTGNIPVRRVLRELSYENVKVVNEQELPNGEFPTVKYPNPEEKEVFNIALKKAKKFNPDIILGTDPDCDRIGVVVRDNMGQYKVLSGNQVGVLLSNYIISSLKEEGKLLDEHTLIKTIVSTEMVKPICQDYKVKIHEVLTGFKYIGECIERFNSQNYIGNKFLFGYEESYGYLAGEFVRDKDAVIAATLICEMTLYYKCIGKSLYDALIGLYRKYGFYKEKLISISLKGKEGRKKINDIMENLRQNTFENFGQFKVVYKEDYKLGIRKNIVSLNKEKINLPISNVIKFIFDDKSYFVVRPSGTEPKIKLYLGVNGRSIEEVEKKINDLGNVVKKIY